MIIKIIFKIIGAAAVSAKRLWEFKIAEKNDAKDTSIKNGKVILVRSIAKSIFLHLQQTLGLLMTQILA